MLSVTNKQIIVFALVIGLVGGMFGSLIAGRIEMWYWRLFRPIPEEIVDMPKQEFIVPLPLEDPPIVAPIVGDFKQLWLDGEIARVNLEENYIIIQPFQPVHAEEIKVFLDPKTRIKQTKIKEAIIDDFKPGTRIFLESNEDIRGKTILETEVIDMIEVFLLPSSLLQN